MQFLKVIDSFICCLWSCLILILCRLKGSESTIKDCSDQVGKANITWAKVYHIIKQSIWRQVQHADFISWGWVKEALHRCRIKSKCTHYSVLLKGPVGSEIETQGQVLSSICSSSNIYSNTWKINKMYPSVSSFQL